MGKHTTNIVKADLSIWLSTISHLTLTNNKKISSEPLVTHIFTQDPPQSLQYIAQTNNLQTLDTWLSHNVVCCVLILQEGTQIKATIKQQTVSILYLLNIHCHPQMTVPTSF